jgi:hypothetical protein
MDPKAQADLWNQQHTLARAKGKTPEQVAARREVVELFCRVHLPADPPPTTIDYQQPIAVINGRTVNTENPKATGFLGLGPKPLYLVSKAIPPKTDQDPIHCLEFFPLKN